MAGQLIEFPSNGSTTPAYLATPASGSGAAVIVIQEWWGLVDHIKQLADRFAAEGFVALAPDMYHGESTDSPDEAGRLMMALDIDRAARDLSGAVTYLVGLDEVSPKKVGTIGFCMGGQLALATACQSPDVGACVNFYGVHPNINLDFSTLRAPVMGLFAENDAFVTPEIAGKLDHDLQSAGATTDFHVYPGVDHGFFNDTRPDVHDEAAASDAWRRTLEFFNANLK